MQKYLYLPKNTRNARVTYWKIEQKKLSNPFGLLNFFSSCGERDRTTDLWVMSPASYHCSTPRCVASRGFEPRQAEPKSVVLPLHHEAIAWFATAKVMRFFELPKVL